MGRGRGAEELSGLCLGPAHCKGPVSCAVTSGEGPPGEFAHFLHDLTTFSCFPSRCTKHAHCNSSCLTRPGSWPISTRLGAVASSGSFSRPSSSAQWALAKPTGVPNLLPALARPTWHHSTHSSKESNRERDQVPGTLDESHEKKDGKSPWASRSVFQVCTCWHRKLWCASRKVFFASSTTMNSYLTTLDSRKGRPQKHWTAALQPQKRDPAPGHTSW